MSDEFSIRITGLKETQKALYAYSQQLGDKVVVASLMQGARHVQRGMKAAAPVRSGRLKRGIVARKSKIHNGRRRADMLGVYVTLRGGKGKKDPKDAFYGRWVEDGFTDRAGRWHPGSKFMKTAFSQRTREAIQIVTGAVRAGAEIIKRRTGFR